MSRKKRIQRRSPAPSSHPGQHDPGSRGCLPIEILSAAGLAVLLSWVFWGVLWSGGGLIGGDLYPYYFPQKAFLSESLKSGVVPFWNPLVGFGYPVLGESQTGVLYPPNLLLYWLFTPNTAYNVSQILHYVVAFGGIWGLGRRLGLNPAGAALAATVFVYGWFPARICLEWAIIGGAWFALILWSAAHFLQTGSRRALFLTSVGLGLALLAGHYNLAFITLLTLVPLWLLVPGTASGAPVPPSSLSSAPVPTPACRNEKERAGRLKEGFILAAAIACGFLIAGVQLLPSWELKRLSQRQEVTEVFAPTYGHLPPAAVSQLWLPWSWYAGEELMDRYLERHDFLAVPAATNQVEAQLYVGLIPLGLVLLGLLLGPVRRRVTLVSPLGWLALAGISLFFATGWPTHWFSDLPGIGFFRGPGRYSIVAVLAFALLAGGAWDALARRGEWSSRKIRLLTAALLTFTVADLWTASRQYSLGEAPRVGRQVFYVVLVDDPPIKHLGESPLREFFADKPQARLYAPGPNVPSLLGVSSIPTYLGLGPEIYESGQIRFDFSTSDPEQIAESMERLRRFGVTHLLLEEPLEPAPWPVRRIGEVVDPFLNRAFGRREPYHFYEVEEARGRIFSIGAPPPSASRVLSLESSANRVRAEIEWSEADELVLADLWYPGWRVSDAQFRAKPYRGLFRSVELPEPSAPRRATIEWAYRPGSFLFGALLSVLGLLAAVLMPRLLRRIGF